MGMRRVVINIDRLVLRHFGRTDSQAISDAIRAELARGLADPATTARLAALGSVVSRHAGNVRLPHGGSPHALGTAAGRAIGRGIQR